MPVHRAPDDADSLARAVEAALARGETVLQVIPWGNEFLILTKPARSRRTATRGPRETRRR